MTINFKNSLRSIFSSTLNRLLYSRSIWSYLSSGLLYLNWFEVSLVCLPALCACIILSSLPRLFLILSLFQLPN